VGDKKYETKEVKCGRELQPRTVFWSLRKPKGGCDIAESGRDGSRDLDGGTVRLLVSRRNCRVSMQLKTVPFKNFTRPYKE